MSNAKVLSKAMTFAVECLGIGGNGEGWKLTDIIDVGRLALGETRAGGRWNRDMTPEEIERVRGIMGDEWVDDALGFGPFPMLEMTDEQEDIFVACRGIDNRYMAKMIDEWVERHPEINQYRLYPGVIPMGEFLKDAAARLRDGIYL